MQTNAAVKLQYEQSFSELLRDEDASVHQIVNRFVETGPQMIDDINAQSPSLVVDLACGFNPYKGLINNLVGLDISKCKRTDIISSFLSTPFQDHQVDVLLCLTGHGYVPHNTRLWDEVKRIAKPGAIMYCRCANRPLRHYGYHRASERAHEIADMFGFEFIQPPIPATYTDDNDSGVYFNAKEQAVDTNHIARQRWFWTWKIS